MVSREPRWLEACRDLWDSPVEGGWSERAWRDLAGGALWQACQAIVRAAAQRDGAALDQTLTRLNRAWGCLGRAAPRLVRVLARQDAEPTPTDKAAAGALLEQARRLVATTALAAVLPNLASVGRGSARLEGWRRRLAGELTASGPARLTSVSDDPAAVADRPGLAAAAASLAAPSYVESSEVIETRLLTSIADPDVRAAVRLTLLELRDSGEAARCQVPVLFVHRVSGEGVVGQLSLVVRPSDQRAKPGRLLQSAELLRPVGSDWRVAFQEAGEREAPALHQRYAGADVSWNLTVKTEPTEPIDDTSAQAALQVGLRCLARGLPYSGEFAVSAVVDEQGKLGHVKGLWTDTVALGPKLSAAAGSRITRVVVNDDDAKRVNAAARLEPEPAGPNVLGAATVEEALELITGTTVALRQYLRAVIERPDRDRPPWYRTSSQAVEYRLPSAHYLEPALIELPRELPVRRPDDPSARTDAEPHAQPNRPLGVAARDLNEDAAYGEHWASGHQRSWAELANELRGRRRWLVVLGPPGMGKTLFAQMRARQQAARALDALAAGARLDALELPLVVPLAALAQVVPNRADLDEAALRAGLREVLRSQFSAEHNPAGAVDPTAAREHWEVAVEHLLRVAAQPRVWFYLDGLDEVNPERLAPLLRPFQLWASRTVLLSRPHGYDRSLVPVAPIPATDAPDVVAEYRLAPLGLTPSREFIRAWFGDDTERGVSLARVLEREPAICQLGEVAYLLTLICWIGQRRAISAEVTRTELCSWMVDDLLGLDPDRSPRPDAGRARQWRPFLEELAFSLLARDPEMRQIDGPALQRALLESRLRPPTSGTDPSDSPLERVARLIAELGRKRVLKETGPGTDHFEPPHRSLLEYLAGAALARQLEPADDPLDGSVAAEAAARREAAWTWLSRKAWDPRFEQVLLYCVGSLKDPALLLEHLSDQQPNALNPWGDDEFRHRLGLAARALDEVRGLLLPAVQAGGGAAPRRLADVTNEIAVATFEIYWTHTGRDTKAAVPWLAETMFSIGRLLNRVRRRSSQGSNSRIHGEARSHLSAAHTAVDLLDFLVTQLNSDRATSRIEAINAVSAASVTTEDVATSLLALREDTDTNVRAAANAVLRSLGGPAVVDALWDVFRAEFKNLGRQLGFAPVESQVEPRSVEMSRDVLRTRVEDPYWFAPRPSARPLKARSGPMVSGAPNGAKATGTRLTGLPGRPSDPDGRVRTEGVGELEKVAETAATEVVAALLARLKNPDPIVQGGAADALGQMGAAAATEAVVAALLAQLTDTDWAARRAAEDARVGKMSGAREPTGELSQDGQLVAQTLVDLERVQVFYTRRSIVVALVRLSRSIATTTILTAFLARLESPDDLVRSAVIAGLCVIGAAPTSGAVLAGLFARLEDADQRVRSDAAFALGYLQQSGARYFRLGVETVLSIDALAVVGPPG